MNNKIYYNPNELPKTNLHFLIRERNGKMNKGKKAFQEIYAHAKYSLELDAPELLHHLELRKDVVEKELKKPQEIYNLIQQKRDNARLELENGRKRQDISNEEKSELLGEICAYNDILSLMESMK